VFSYLRSKSPTHSTYVWRHKDVKAQRAEHVATRLPIIAPKIYHTRAKQVKRTQMVATAAFTIRVFVTFSDCQESKATKPSRERMWGLNQKRRQENLTFWKFDKISALIYSVSYVKLEGLSPPMLLRGYETALNFPIMLSLLHYDHRIK